MLENIPECVQGEINKRMLEEICERILRKILEEYLTIFLRNSGKNHLGNLERISNGITEKILERILQNPVKESQ